MPMGVGTPQGGGAVLPFSWGKPEKKAPKKKPAKAQKKSKR